MVQVFRENFELSIVRHCGEVRYFVAAIYWTAQKAWVSIQIKQNIGSTTTGSSRSCSGRMTSVFVRIPFGAHAAPSNRVGVNRSPQGVVSEDFELGAVGPTHIAFNRGQRR